MIALVAFCSLYVWLVLTHHDQIAVVVASDEGKETAASSFLSHPSHGNPSDVSGSDFSIRVPSSASSTTNGKFAYAFLLGGALSKKYGSDHRGGLYSVVVAAHNLRKSGSTSDIILMVQISASSNATRLPAVDEEVLQKMNIRTVYLPKYASIKFEKFYNLMLEKFRILDFDEYDRILYLDYDVFPRCNLDYVMELSYNSTLKENVILAHLKEPASGGFFVLKPEKSDYTKLSNIIQYVENKTMNEPFPHWNKKEGWGAVIDPRRGDYWINSQ
ncbi:MAG: hypothetical protein SGILL_009515, partial [Bacillariaceae sp.]